MSLESHRACLWVIELQIQPCNSLTTWQNSAKEQPQDCGWCNQYLDSTFARDLNWRRLLSLDCRVDIHNKNTLRRLSVPPYGSPSGSMIWSKSGSMTTKQLTQKHYIDGLWIDYWLLWHLTLHTICLDGLGQNMAHRVLVTLALCSSVVMHSVGKSVLQSFGSTSDQRGAGSRRLRQLDLSWGISSKSWCVILVVSPGLEKGGKFAATFCKVILLTWL